jgi:hypothetical protein
MIIACQYNVSCMPDTTIIPISQIRRHREIKVTKLVNFLAGIILRVYLTPKLVF